MTQSWATAVLFYCFQKWCCYKYKRWRCITSVDRALPETFMPPHKMDRDGDFQTYLWDVGNWSHVFNFHTKSGWKQLACFETNESVTLHVLKTRSLGGSDFINRSSKWLCHFLCYLLLQKTRKSSVKIQGFRRNKCQKNEKAPAHFNCICQEARGAA